MTSKSTVPAFVINTTYHLHPEDAEAYKALAARFAKATDDWDGCLFTNVGQDVRDPSVFHLVEGWRRRVWWARNGAFVRGFVSGVGVTLLALWIARLVIGHL